MDNQLTLHKDPPPLTVATCMSDKQPVPAMALPICVNLCTPWGNCE